MRSSINTKALLLLVSAASLLAGCVSRNETAIIAGGVRPATAQNGTFTTTRTVVVGQTSTLDAMWNLNPDCTTRTNPTVRIVEQPVHGTVAINQRTDYPNYPTNNPRSACNKTQQPGVFVDYTPAPGFAGTDIVSFEEISDRGVDRTWKMILTVK